MRVSALAALLAICGCASAPSGPSDAEVQTILDAQLQEVVAAISSGNSGEVVRWFAADGVMTVQGVMAGDGGMLNVELSGREQIATFLNQVPAPPDFYMQVSGFARTGDEAEQTGSWSIAGEQSGTFGVNWRQNADGLWQIVRWDFIGF